MGKRLILAFAAILLAAAADAQLNGDEPPTIQFNHTKIGAIDLRAISNIEWQENEPFVRAIWCYGRSPSFRFGIDRFGEMKFFFTGEGPPDAEGNALYDYGDLNIRWLKIGAAKFETRAQATNYPRDRFSDFSYKPDSEDRIQLASFSGHLMVRRNMKSPWLKLTTLLPQIMNERTIWLGIDDRNDDSPSGRGKIAVKVDVSALQQALKWCDDSINSERAYRLDAG